MMNMASDMLTGSDQAAHPYHKKLKKHLRAAALHLHCLQKSESPAGGRLRWLGAENLGQQ